MAIQLKGFKMVKISIVAMAIMGASFQSYANGENYVARVPVNLYKSYAGDQKEAEEPNSIVVSLSEYEQSVIPAQVGSPFFFDFNGLLSISDGTGNIGYNLEEISWTKNSGSDFPGEISFSGGVMSGTPTQKNSSGASFEVVASYNGESGKRTYTIIVGGAALQVTKISAGDQHACAIRPDGVLKCWGYNIKGQLGYAAATRSPIPQTVASVTDKVLDVAVGANHTCALIEGGSVKCWGSNENGQLGSNNSIGGIAPQNVYGLGSGVASITAGENHSCARMQTGALKCWGYNYNGQVGDGNAYNTKVIAPKDVIGLTEAALQVEAGRQFTCALLQSGGVKCWGRNMEGQTGRGTSGTIENTPGYVSGLTANVESIDAGYDHACALMTSGEVKCWGKNNFGQSGSGSISEMNTSPVTVSGGDTARSVSVGGENACMITTSGALKCWGSGGGGAIGIGMSDLNHKSSPVQVTTLETGVKSVSVGYALTCASTFTGAKCWGLDTQGQLGDNEKLQGSAIPVEVSP